MQNIKALDWLLILVGLLSIFVISTAKNEAVRLASTSTVLFISGVFLVTIYFGLQRSYFVQTLHEKNKSPDGRQVKVVLWLGLAFCLFSIFWFVISSVAH